MLQILIDLPERIYDDILDDQMPSREQVSVLVQHIQNSIVLPKNHGRLIDGDYLYDKFKANGIESIENGSFALQLIKDEPTVLEADGGAEVE